MRTSPTFKRLAATSLAVASLTVGSVVAAAPAAYAAATGRVVAQPCLNQRTSPSGTVLQCIPYNTTLTINCTLSGPGVTGPYGTLYTWDQVTYGGKTGYVSDAWMYTGSNNPVAGTCGATSSIDSFKAWALNSANWNSTTPYGYRGIDYDGWYGAQCADLGIAWSARVGRRVGFDGWDTSAASKPGWYPINATLASARPGDVVTRVGGVQHVVVIVGWPSGGLIPVLQQNPKSPHVANYYTSTSGVIWRMS